MNLDFRNIEAPDERERIARAQFRRQGFRFLEGKANE